MVGADQGSAKTNVEVNGKVVEFSEEDVGLGGQRPVPAQGGPLQYQARGWEGCLDC